MKKITLVLSLFTLILASCSGSDGRDGIDGLDGLDAPKPTVFEDRADYTYNADGNIWVSQLFTFDGSEPGDVYLAYISLNNDGVFTNMPTSIFDDQGEFQYVFDHDFDTVEMQIIGDSDLSGLDAASTTNVQIRIAIIPADLVGSFDQADFANYDSLMSALDIQESDIQTLD